MPLPMIERKIMPFMGGADYLGPEFNGNTYRLKFMRGGRVIWVDVDGRSGQIIGRTDAELWNPDATPPALLTPGRVVRFRAVS